MTETDAHRELDYLVYGATGFVGRRVARGLADQRPDATIGLCARSMSKLEPVLSEVRHASSASTAEAERRIVAVQADSTQPSSVREAVGRARVVLACAGPFARYGTPVVEACVEQGTHYVDITGETPWVRSLIERFHDHARREGTLIVPLSGYDSVPSDLGTFLAVRALRERHDQGTRRVVALMAGGGGLNGGTAQSALDLYSDPTTRAVFEDPYALCPDLRVDPVARKEEKDSFRPRKDLDGQLRPPFLMASINSRVVRRSACLYAAADEPYGAAFRYDELMDLGRKAPKAKALVGSSLMAAADKALRVGPVRSAAARFLPEPGSGPTDEVIEGGFSRTRIQALGEGGARVNVLFQAQGDPGNAVTAALLIASARCLGEHGGEVGAGEPGRGGVLTPAYAFGEVLAERLRDAGMTLTDE